MNKESHSEKRGQVGVAARILADVCHSCGICPYADKKPQSSLGKIMRWHRTWCPAWAAHAKVYGRKPLS
jgi:hypothetical protein